MKYPILLVPVVLLAAGVSAAQGGNGNLKQKVTKAPAKAATNEQAHAVKTRPGDKVSINPQPLPPVAGGHVHKGSAGDKVSINPQPLPPRVGNNAGSPGEKVSLNPQPLPPKVGNNFRKSSPSDKVSLNPQPLPPKVGNNGNGIQSGKISSVSKSKTPKVGQGVTGGPKNIGSQK